jgi:hypothetical protein
VGDRDGRQTGGDELEGGGMYLCVPKDARLHGRQVLRFLARGWCFDTVGGSAKNNGGQGQKGTKLQNKATKRAGEWGGSREASLCLERKDHGRSTVSPALGALEPMGRIRYLGAFAFLPSRAW